MTLAALLLIDLPFGGDLLVIPGAVLLASVLVRAAPTLEAWVPEPTVARS